MGIQRGTGSRSDTTGSSGPKAGGGGEGGGTEGLRHRKGREGRGGQSRNPSSQSRNWVPPQSPGAELGGRADGHPGVGGNGGGTRPGVPQSPQFMALGRCAPLDGGRCPALSNAPICGCPEGWGPLKARGDGEGFGLGSGQRGPLWGEAVTALPRGHGGRVGSWKISFGGREVKPEPLRSQLCRPAELRGRAVALGVPGGTGGSGRLLLRLWGKRSSSDCFPPSVPAFSSRFAAWRSC